MPLLPSLRASKQTFSYATHRDEALRLTHACTRAPSNSNVVFLLSQVSHHKKRRGESRNKNPRNTGKKQTLLAVLSSVLGSLKNLFVKTHSNIHHNNLNHSILQILAWHLWQQKDENSCNACVHVRASKGNIGLFTLQTLSAQITIHRKYFFGYRMFVEK